MQRLKRSVLLSCVLLLATVWASVMSMVSVAHAAKRHPLITTTTEFIISAGKDPWGTAMDAKGYVWVAVPGCDPTPTCSASTPPGRFDIFNAATSKWTAGRSLPAGYTQAFFLAFDAGGRAWFPLPMANALGMYDPKSYSFSKWTVPTANVGPWHLAIDKQGNIWFTEHFSNKIGRFNPVTHSFMEVPTPATNSQPYGIAIDSANNVWFTENNPAVALIGEYTAQGQLREYKIRNSFNSGLTPHLIAIDRNGNIWWTEGFVGMIGELVVSKAVPGTNKGVTEYPYSHICGSCYAHTSGIGVDGRGQVWFDDSLQNSFGSFPSSGGTFSMYATPTSGSHPHDGLMVDSQNRTWFDEEFANKIARVVIT